MMSDSTLEELRIRISNYKRTRHTSVGPIRAWCDKLIKDAEDQLRRACEEQETSERHYETASARSHGDYPLV